MIIKTILIEAQGKKIVLNITSSVRCLRAVYGLGATCLHMKCVYVTLCGYRNYNEKIK